MNPVKHAALAAYYWGSLPMRRRRAATRRRRGVEPVSILFYHRVADTHPNGWTMPCKTFAWQIEWIAKRFDVVSLAEAQRRIASGTNARPTVCITFDDGYADNCEFALPLLLRKRLPVTYFVATDNLRTGTPFPHDVAAGVKLRPNSVEEVRAMAGAGVEIGAHTRTHADLGRVVDHDRLVSELAGSKHDLEQTLGRAVRYFAFPFGLHENLSPEAFRVARLAGLAGVCSAYGAYNTPGDDPFHLKRIHADPQRLRLKNWLTVDPRKLRVPDFDPGDLDADPRPADQGPAGRGASGENLAAASDDMGPCTLVTAQDGPSAVEVPD
ncbi:MAG: polysaccharide deacetylase family protein [Planctomycetota bacterium]